MDVRPASPRQKRLQRSYLTGAARALLAEEAFRASPARTVGRGISWLLHVLFQREAHVKFARLGIEMKLPPLLRRAGATSLFVLRDYYDDTLQWVASVLRDGMVVIDGGASLGVYTMVASRRVGATGRVLAFEPGSDSFQYLAKNAKLAPFGNITVLREALSDRVGTAELFHIDDAPNSYSLGGDASAREVVRTTTIDRVVEEHGLERLDLVKLDVEGAEEMTLRGSRRALFEFRPIVVFENDPARAKALGSHPSGAWDILHPLGYSLFKPTSTPGLVPISRPVVGNNVAIPPARERA